jgi:hypothetical protein
MATPDATSMTPAAALARHLEWLEYALAAAREEEDRRRDRLSKATSKNRDKRTARLAEVSSEVVELSALVQGIKSLQAAAARPKPAAAARGPRRNSATKASATRKSPGRPRGGSKAASGTKTAPATAPADASGTSGTAATNGTGPAKAAKKRATRPRRSTTRRSGSSS